MPETNYSLTKPENYANKQTGQYQVTRQTFHVPGLVQQPAGGPEGTPCLFTRAHVPYEYEVVTWIASSDFGPPTPPNPYGPQCTFGLNDNRILLDMKFGAIVPTPVGGMQSGHAWTMTGVYVYGKVQPEHGSGRMGAVPLGKLFYEEGPVGANFIPPEAFVQGVIDPNFPTPIYQMPARPLDFLNPVQGATPPPPEFLNPIQPPGP